MSLEATEAGVREVLQVHGRLNRPAAEVKADADLFAIGLDSQAVINVMLAIEEKFDFEFPEDKLNRAAFTTIRAIADVVESASTAA